MGRGSGTGLAAGRAAVAGNGARQPLRRRPLPNGRAVVGALLVAVAAVGIFLAYTGVTVEAAEQFVVVRRAVSPGEVLRPGDVGLAAMRLPDGLARSRAFRDPARVIGAALLAPLAPGELLQASAVVTAVGDATRHVAVSVDAARALAGDLRVGEIVDVVATFGAAADAYSVVVVRGARVVGRHSSRSGIGGRGGELVTLAVTSDGSALALAHAGAAASVSFIRMGGAPSANGRDAGGSYRPPRPEGARS